MMATNNALNTENPARAVAGQDFYNGTFIDRASTSIASNGTVITITVTADTGTMVTISFSTGLYEYDLTTPATVTLTAGTDTVPVQNYVYMLESTKGTLTVSTVGFPNAEHARIATVVCQSAASLQTQGAYKFHQWIDTTRNSIMQGSNSNLNYWIRRQAATWQSGVSLTATAGAGQLDVATTTGVVLQLNPHDFPVYNTGTGSFALVVNDPTTAYKSVTDLSTILVDANGNTLTGRYYNLVFWGVASEDAADCKLMVNLPINSTTNQTQAQDDRRNYAIYSIPEQFRGTGFLMSRVTIRNQGDTTWTISQQTDLRGLVSSTSAGGGGGITALVEDPDPTLGANLKLNTHSIVAPSSTISDFLDDDTFATASATTGATSESIKAYVDSSSSSGISALTVVAQATHNLTVGMAIKGLASGTYEAAQADSAANAEVVGIVTIVPDNNNFTFVSAGQTLEMVALTANSVYFLSEATPGLMTLTEPTTAGQISRPVLYTDTTTSGFYLPYRGIEVGSVGSTAATQADQETGTSITTFVSPGRQQYHDSASKAWVHFNGTGTIAIDESYNVTSLVDDGVGQYRVNFTVSFATSNYAAAGMVQRVTNVSSAGFDNTTANTTGTAYIDCTGTAGFVDPNRVSVVFFGDQ